MTESIASTATLANLDKQYHLHSQTNPQQLQQKGPMVIDRGEGAYIYDKEGNKYIDGMAGLWCASLGFGNQRLADAAYAKAKEIGFYHTFFSRTSDVTAELSEKLSKMSLIDNGRVFFATSGSEATETMVKLAWVYHAVRGKPTKRKVISRMKAFHGSTIAAASMCGLESMHREFALPIAGFIHTLCPSPYREMRAGESEHDFVERLALELEYMIVREGPDTIAAFIAEPIMAGGGVIVPPADYFRRIRQVLDKYDILMLDDEVVNGFGRTGNWFGRETTGMRPHMMAMAKGLTSSYFPMSAVVMTPEIHDSVAEFNKNGGFFGHGFTNSGHPVGAAVALECIKIYEEMDLIPHVRAVGGRLRQRIETIAAASSIIGEVRGAGLMLGMELVSDKATKTPFGSQMGAGFKFDAIALQKGLVVRAMGDTIVLSPPLIITDEVADEIADCFEQALTAFEAQSQVA